MADQHDARDGGDLTLDVIAVDIPEDVLVRCLKAIDPLNGLVDWQPSVGYDGVTRDHIRKIAEILARISHPVDRQGDLPSVEAFAEALYDTDPEIEKSGGRWTDLHGSSAAVVSSVRAPYRTRAAALRARLAEQPGGARPTDAKGHPLDCRGCPDCRGIGLGGGIFGDPEYPHPTETAEQPGGRPVAAEENSKTKVDWKRPIEVVTDGDLWLYAEIVELIDARTAVVCYGAGNPGQRNRVGVFHADGSPEQWTVRNVGSDTRASSTTSADGHGRSTSAPDAGESRPMSETAYLHFRIVEAARTWAEERIAKDSAEKQLMVTLFDAFPLDFCGGKDFCSCEEKDDCDECLTSAEIKATINRWRNECSTPYRDAPARALPGSTP